MERLAIEALIARNEQLAAQRPAAYRRRVFGVIALGYGYLALVVLVLLALTAVAVLSAVYLKALAIKLVLLTGAPLVLVLRAMVVRFAPPPGIELTGEQAPGLFAAVADLRGRLRTPRVHHILLTADFNAGVTQVPRLGLFGWHRNYLAVGLPLMKTLSVEQFRAVLAHELGHLSRGHARASNWVYRLRLIWGRLDQAFSQTRHWSSGLIRPFFGWYIPYFTATSFPLARANEYEADAASVRLTSVASAAQALTSVAIMARYLQEKYWPTIHSSAKDVPQPAFAPYSRLSWGAIADLPPAQSLRWQEAAMRERTSHADTHPALTDRLSAIGAQAQFAPPSPGESADILLGGQRARWESALDEQWRAQIAASWKRAYDTAQAGRARIGELRSRASQGELNEHEALELASLEESVGAGAAAALAMRRALAQRFPGSLPARFALAHQLLQADDAEGIAPMESVIAASAEARVPGAQLLRDFYRRRNSPDLAQLWEEKRQASAAAWEAARRERQQLRSSDTLAGHRLAAAELARVVQQLESIPGITRAYLVRKLTEHLPERPMLVLGFKCTRWWMLRNRATAHALLHRIRQEVRFPGDALIVDLEGTRSRLAARVRRVKGSRVL
jgi:Zn-dependent protease with chaperone function